jgi:DNA-directed RNA polymerase specialized sigma24 family protein
VIFCLLFQDVWLRVTVTLMKETRVENSRALLFQIAANRHRDHLRRTDLHVVCPSCNRVLQRDWQICPYCRHELKSIRAGAKQVSEIVQTPLGNLPAVS